MDKKIDRHAREVKSKGQRRMICEANQPMTVAQIARRSSITLNWASDCLRKLRDCKLFKCFNPKAKIGRVYWLTRRGRKTQDRICAKDNLRAPERYCPAVDWHLFGRICSSQRSAVVMSMDGGMKVTDIRKKACKENESIKMSSSNCRDVVEFLAKHYILRRGHTDPSIFKLTGLGRKFRRLLYRVYQPEMLEKSPRLMKGKLRKVKRSWKCWSGKRDRRRVPWFGKRERRRMA